MADIIQLVRPIPVWDQMAEDISLLKDSFDNQPISAYAIVVWDRLGRNNVGFNSGQHEDIAGETYDAIVATINAPEEPEIEVILEPTNNNTILGALIDKGIIRPDDK